MRESAKLYKKLIYMWFSILWSKFFEKYGTSVNHRTAWPVQCIFSLNILNFFGILSIHLYLFFICDDYFRSTSIIACFIYLGFPYCSTPLQSQVLIMETISNYVAQIFCSVLTFKPNTLLENFCYQLARKITHI